MKKLILVGLLAATTTFGANASVIEFVDTTFGGSGSEVFDQLDFDADVASVTQVDSNNDDGIFGDAFNEFGATELVNFKLGGGTSLPSAYELIFGYNFEGATSFAGFLQVLFSGGTATLHADTTVNGVLDAGTATKVADFTMAGGDCKIFDNGGFCNITLEFAPVAGYFNLDGVDVATHIAQGAGAWANLVVTVQELVGLFPSYADQEAFLAANSLPSDGANTQKFQIKHDGNMTISVPEPTSLAILGLGLLGFAGVRRRKS